MKKQQLYIFTRTPLHIGTGASVGAIDQPIIRERHTGFPIMPGSSLKGVFADVWNDELKENDKNIKVRVLDAEKNDCSDAAWLFGSDSAKVSFAGAVQFSEAKLLAFPIRSAKGSFAWITSPLILERAVRDGVIAKDSLPNFASLKDNSAIIGNNSKVLIDNKIVLEEYTFDVITDPKLNALGEQLKSKIVEDPVWVSIPERLVVLSDGIMSFFAKNACEVAQHVRISDETGTAEGGALFNLESVPSETMFYSVVHFLKGRGGKFKDKKADDAFEAFSNKIKDQVFQFGGDASTGLGWCSVKLM